jgi:DNA-directed RNA polymerase subunit K/omega
MLTKYECSRIIGIRTVQLDMSAPVLLDLASVPQCLQANNMYIAARELKEGLLDVKVRRPHPFNRYDEVHIRDLALPDDIDALIALYA